MKSSFEKKAILFTVLIGLLIFFLGFASAWIFKPVQASRYELDGLSKQLTEAMHANHDLNMEYGLLKAELKDKDMTITELKKGIINE